MVAWAAPWTSTLAWATAHVVQPALSLLHLSWLDSQASDIARYFVLTMVQVAIVALVLRPLETVWPAERWEQRRTTAIDCRYTLIKLFIVLPWFTYLVLFPLNQWLGGDNNGDGAGLVGVQQMVPWLSAHPLVLFLVYYAIYDFVLYVVHRLQHHIPWWWALHSLHHSQRQLSCWSNDRDHYLDDLLEALIVAGVGVVIGVAPTEYALLVLLGELLQNLGHANIRLHFGPVLGRVLVDPRYHRLHHMRVDPDQPTLHACNYAFIFPIWDILFGTALFGQAVRPTGVCDPTVDADNRHGIVGQQWTVLRRWWTAIRSRAGWVPGDVAFDEHYRPVSVRHIDLHALEREGRPLRAAPRVRGPATGPV